jgi:hypothetical protein
MGAMVVKAVNSVPKGRKTMRAATVAADVCNSRYMWFTGLAVWVLFRLAGAARASAVQPQRFFVCHFNV